MTAECYSSIIKHALVPFLNSVYADGHRFMQDNDPKHTSRLVQKVLVEEGVNWWKTPAESPDYKNLWHEMKEYIRQEVKPTSKDELVKGISDFWETVTVAKCRKYIQRKVLPKVIDVEGAATGY